MMVDGFEICDEAVYEAERRDEILKLKGSRQLVIRERPASSLGMMTARSFFVRMVGLSMAINSTKACRRGRGKPVERMDGATLPVFLACYFVTLDDARLGFKRLNSTWERTLGFTADELLADGIGNPDARSSE